MHALFSHLYDSYNCQNLEEFKKISSAIRKGLSHRPMGEGYFIVNLIIPVLHSKLNSLKYHQELAYSLNSRDAYEKDGGQIFRGQGKKRTKEQKIAKKKAKKRFQKKSKDDCNLPLDLYNSHTFDILDLPFQMASILLQKFEKIAVCNRF